MASMMSCLLLLAASFHLALADVIPEGAIAVPLIRSAHLTYYLAEFSAGTPPQKEFLLMDTGSPTFSFLDPRNPWCEMDTKPCAQYGTFDNTTSSTSVYGGKTFGDDLSDFGSGDLLNDTVTIGGVSIPQMSFGYLSEYAFNRQIATPTTTVAGLAINCADAGPNCTSAGAYLLSQLRNASAIDHVAVSFYLGPDNATDTGSTMVLGGAYDKAKIAGEPLTLKMSDGSPNSVNVTAMSAVVGGEVVNTTFGDVDVGQPVLIDTGNPYWPIPPAIYNPVFAALGSPTYFNSTTNAYNVSCDLRNLDTASNYITTSFAGSEGQITVPVSALVTDFGNNNCGTFVRNSSSVGGWGAPFLRSTYAIYDALNFEVTFAQVKYTTETEYVKLPQAGFGR